MDGLINEQVQNLRRMSAHLRLSERGSLLIVSTPDVNADRAIAEELRLWVRDKVEVLEFTFQLEPLEQLSLSHQLRTLPPPHNKSALFVFGLDELSPNARATCIDSLNWGRERLAWAGYSVVLWVRSKSVTDLAFKAPDFFSWRSGVFEFTLSPDPTERTRALTQLRLFAPASLAELRQRYCDYVVRTYQWLDFRGLLQLRNVVRLPLDEVFIPLQATTTIDYPLLPDLPPTPESTIPDEWRRYERQRLERRVALNDAVRQHHSLVVLGDPGSGKSTLLRYLALAFAQGKQQVEERLGISEDRVAILVPLSALAEARKTQSDLPLAAFLPRFFLEQGLPDFSPLFDDVLSSGRALVLLDGLDEMLTADDRTAVARAIVEFTNTHPTSRVVITSRIAGYAPGTLPASFATFTIAPLGDEAIKQFAQQWSLAFEAIGLPPHTELPPEVRRRAQLRADSLTAAATGHPGVRRLATNPLLLTLLALIHYQGTRLPNRRTDLYRLCVEALAETWNLARSLSGRPIDLRLGERRLDEEFVVHVLAPVAYWMHEHKPTEIISREELEARVAEQFATDGSPTDAPTLARDFVNLAREQMGLLVERAPDEFSFLHLSVQEYLAARFLSERKDGFERLRPRLHHSRWREVVLLTAGCLRGDYASEFVENILNAHSPYDELLHRDLLLAARCIGDDVPVPLPLRRNIGTILLALWQRSPFRRLSDEIARTFRYLKTSDIGVDFFAFLLGTLQNKREKEELRSNAVWTIQQIGERKAEVVKVLLDILRDEHESFGVQMSVMLAIGTIGQGNTEVIATLLHILKHGGQDTIMSAFVPLALGQAGQGDTALARTLLSIVQEKGESETVRGSAIAVLGHVGQGDEETIRTLLNIVQDKRETVRWFAITALGQVGQEDEEVSRTLLGILQDKSEDRLSRWRAVTGLLFQAARENTEVMTTLRNIVQDKKEDLIIRQFILAILPFGVQLRTEERTILLSIVYDRTEEKEIRGSALLPLGRTGQGNPEVINLLLDILQDKSEDLIVRENAAKGLGYGGQGEAKEIAILLQVADEPPLRDASLGALWDVLTRGA